MWRRARFEHEAACTFTSESKNAVMHSVLHGLWLESVAWLPRAISAMSACSGEEWFRVDFCRSTFQNDPTLLPSTILSSSQVMAEPPSKRSKTSTPSAEAGPSTPIDNPYLAHRNPAASSTMATGTNGVASDVKNPLAGLVPRRVSVEQAKNIMVSGFYPSVWIVLTPGRRGQPVQGSCSLLGQLQENPRGSKEFARLPEDARVPRHLFEESDHGDGGSDWIGKDDADPTIRLLLGPAESEGQDGGVYATPTSGRYVSREACGGRDGCAARQAGGILDPI